MTQETKKAFTLVEISVVLVIIALIAAGILVGYGLVDAAKLRKVIADKERFDGITQAFVTKYGALPGDLKDLSLLPGAAPRANTAGHGNNDGMLDNTMWAAGGGTVSTSRNQCGEVLLYWSDLAVAGYLPDIGAPAAQDGSAGTCVPAAVAPSTGLNRLLPISPLSGVYWMLSRSKNQCCSGSDPRLHYYLLAILDSIDTNGDPIITNSAAVPGAAALSIDQKIDDGLQNTGNVQGGYAYGNASGSAFYPAGTTYATTAGSGYTMSFKTAW